LQFNRQRLATHRFKKTAPKRPMNRHRSADDSVGLWIVEIFTHDSGQLHEPIPVECPDPPRDCCVWIAETATVAPRAACDFCV
jgi:hypothetical protein